MGGLWIFFGMTPCCASQKLINEENTKESMSMKESVLHTINTLKNGSSSNLY